MIHVPGKAIFIRISRTGTTAVSKALLEACPHAVIHDDIYRHATAYELARIVPQDEWDACVKFTILRNPLDIIESDWRFVQQQRQIVNLDDPELNPMFVAKLRRSFEYTFDDFVRNEWCGRYSILMAGGFIRTWCYGLVGEDYGVQTLWYGTLDKDWEALCDRLEIAHVPIPRLPTIDMPRGQWTNELRQLVLDICWMDRIV